MRVFLVFCLCATAFAVPQGYNYQQQLQQQQQQHQQQQQQSTASFQVPNLSFIHEAFKKPNLPSQHSQAQQFSATPQFSNNKPLQQIQPQQQSFGFANLPQQQQQQQQQQPSVALGFGGQQQFQSQQQFPPQYQSQRYQPAAPITKDIYVHVAPDEPEQAQYQQQLPPAPPRKHYRIVFIKAPTPKINSAALRISQAPVEEKTIIYVLTKKPDPLDFQAAIQEAHPKQPSKPEVYFIKYKTQEEAQHAQRTIQAQYDQLGGTTQVSDEGIAPVTSVIGSLDGQQSRGGVSSQSFSSSSPSFASSSSSSSLPSSLSSSSSSSTSSSSSLSGASTPNVSNYLPPIVKL